MTDKEKIRKEVERIRSLHQMKYQQLDTDNSMSLVECGKRNLCNELLLFIDSLQEEPVSDDLEEATNNYCVNVRKGYPRVKDETDRYICNAFKAGAEWQKEQFEKNRLAHCDAQTEEEAEREWNFCMRILNYEHRQPTYDDAIKYGMRLQKEQIKAKAVEVTVHIDAGNYPYIPQLELYDYDKNVPLAKEGDKYKVVLIKEDEL